MRDAPFTRPTILAAVELFDFQSQASFDQAVLRLGLENDIPSDTSLSVKKKCGLLGRIAVQRATEVLSTLDGTTTLVEAVVREAISLDQAQFAASTLSAAHARPGAGRLHRLLGRRY